MKTYITSIFILEERPKSVILRKMRKSSLLFLFFIYFAYFCITALVLMENYTFFMVSEADGGKSRGCAAIETDVA